MKQGGIKGLWWKLTGAVLFLYTIIGGLLIEVPDVDRLHDAIRNLFYHVPLWFGMTLILLISLVYSIRHLRKPTERFDLIAVECVNVGVVFGILGFITGTIWGSYSWGNISFFLREEPKVLAALAGVLVYLAYLVLRGSINEEQKRGRISAVYNIFAYVMFIVFIMVVPRMVEESLHPGNGGNPGLDVNDSDHTLKLVFYPAVVAYLLIGSWLVDIRVRTRALKNRILEK